MEASELMAYLVDSYSIFIMSEIMSIFDILNNKNLIISDSVYLEIGFRALDSIIDVITPF